MRYEKINLENVVKESYTLSDVARNLGLKPTKGNRDTIKKYISIYNLDTSHFCFKQVGKNNEKIDLENILVENSTYARHHLKKRLFEEGLKQKVCEGCGQDENWRGKKISLILDHINGISNDNRLENLRILCPNCNATLDTNCGKNNKQYDYSVNNTCIDCGIAILNLSKRCLKCDHIKQRKVERPDINTLIEEIKQMGYVKTGKKYGVSDNAIRKWVK